MESPCIRHCTLDAQDVCVGCRRTLDEILRWTTMTAAERQAVMARTSVSPLSRRNPPSA
jgi:predicted Fe-S protein YdhL (DUF1289 family)